MGSLVPMLSITKLVTKYSQAGLLWRGYRYREGFTQKQLAEKVGIQVKKIRSYELGEKVPVDIHKKIIEILRISQ